MFVAGIDAHATYSVIAIVSNTGQLAANVVTASEAREVDAYRDCSKHGLYC